MTSFDWFSNNICVIVTFFLTLYKTEIFGMIINFVNEQDFLNQVQTYLGQK